MTINDTLFRVRDLGIAAACLAAAAAMAPAYGQSAQNIPAGSVFFEPLTPPSSPKVHPYVPPNPMLGRASTGSQHATDDLDAGAVSGSSMPPGAAAGASRPPGASTVPAATPAPLFGVTSDCNAASGGTVSGRTSTTTALDCAPVPGAGHNQR
jgi:hypothetical protein